MKNLPNIEASAYRRAEYVGYGYGIWRVHRYSTGNKRWRAKHIAHETAPVLYGPTLANLSVQIERYQPR